LAGTHPFNTCFERGGTVVGLLGLVADDRQLAVEALVAQGFGATEPGEGRANDDDPAVGLEGGDDIRHE
jgi:hypothetical protein